MTPQNLNVSNITVEDAATTASPPATDNDLPITDNVKHGFATLFLLQGLLTAGGNCFVLYVLCRSGVYRRTPSAGLAINIAVSDILLAAALLLHACLLLNEEYLYSKGWCLCHGLLMAFSSIAVQLSLLLVVAERFIAIKLPFHYSRAVRPGNIVVAVCVVWAYSLLIVLIALHPVYSHFDGVTVCMAGDIFDRNYVLLVVVHYLLVTLLSLLANLSITVIACRQNAKVRAATMGVVTSPKPRPSEGHVPSESVRSLAALRFCPRSHELSAESSPCSECGHKQGDDSLRRAKSSPKLRLSPCPELTDPAYGHGQRSQSLGRDKSSPKLCPSHCCEMKPSPQSTEYVQQHQSEPLGKSRLSTKPCSSQSFELTDCTRCTEHGQQQADESLGKRRFSPNKLQCLKPADCPFSPRCEQGQLNDRLARTQASGNSRRPGCTGGTVFTFDEEEVLKQHNDRAVPLAWRPEVQDPHSQVLVWPIQCSNLLTRKKSKIAGWLETKGHPVSHRPRKVW